MIHQCQGAAIDLSETQRTSEISQDHPTPFLLPSPLGKVRFVCLCWACAHAFSVYPAFACISLLCSWLLTKGPWCCSSSVSCCGSVVLLLSSLPLISKAQPDCSVPVVIRLPGSVVCVAGRATESEPMRHRTILYPIDLWCLACVILSLLANRMNLVLPCYCSTANIWDVLCELVKLWIMTHSVSWSCCLSHSLNSTHSLLIYDDNVWMKTC